MDPYPKIIYGTQEDITQVLETIIQQREDDVLEIEAIQGGYFNGRKVQKIPDSPTDISPADQLNDISFDPDFMYVTVNNNGNLEWRRVALSTW